jgi:xylulose-5-phosphate/fructose-6-phosphate phosphoketolase
VITIVLYTAPSMADTIEAMIFLNDNVLLEEKLIHDHIKPRLLGHWGTCPGLIMVYAHLNRIIRNTGLDALYVVGPGKLLGS